ncbi:autophagy-related protein 18f [Sesamum indicum]|uniref:Autophagy-related protein 18f n=1 Tax=Sesamum indicum TaxID=4182 RepID=A0A6I9UIQ4_SESIN|nr:autophagy-related protein 18f [Sesamum indicum]
MRNDGQKSGDGGALVPRPGRGNNGIIPNSFKALSSYLRVVSSGASTVASTVRSAASAASSAIVERDGDTYHDQVSWAGFDKLELERGTTRQILLLGFSYGFQVWDVEVADNVCNLVSRHDGPVSFLQLLPKPLATKQSGDNFADNRPLLVICADGSFSGGNNDQEGSGTTCNGSTQQCHGSVNNSCVPTVVWFYSLRSQSYVHLLRFRSVVHLVRCSSRVVAVLQSTQIHCFNAATLEREYTILTNPVPIGCYGSGNIGCGPLAVGPRWMAYSGSQVAISNSGRISPQHLTSSPTFPCPASNGSLVAHYAKESSRQLAAGIVTLGDMGYKKLSRYYSELLPEGNNGRSGTARVKVHDIVNGHSPDADNVGMVIVRDIVSKTVIAQFRAHKSPILSLCFDPSGTLLVTASVQGHNINVFRIMPGNSGGSGAASGSSYVHLYRLQRGLTNAVIQDISFSCDSKWIMISSSRGTSHLFAISPSGGLVNFQSTDAFVSTRGVGPSLTTKPAVRGSPSSGLQVLTQQDICASGPTVTLSAVSRIRNGSNGWRNTVSGAAAAATGWSSSLCGAIASTFHNCKGNDMHGDSSSLNRNYYLLVFSPGSMTQYLLHFPPAYNGMRPGVSVTSESSFGYDARLMVEPIQKWNICQKQNCKERGDNIDTYGENGNPDSSKVYPEKMKCENDVFSDVLGTTTKEKITMEEKHHMHISEAELQMHQNQNPLWARSEIYFQSMLTDGFNIKEEGACGGEIEIERVPTRMLEARSRGLVPVFDYLQTPKSQQGRITDGNNNGQIDPQGSDVSEYGKLAGRSSSGSLDSIANAGIIDDEYSLHDKGQDGLQFTETSGGFVNTNDTPIVNAWVDNVNTRDNSVTESQHRSVHTIDGLKVENQSAEGDEFD